MPVSKGKVSFSTIVNEADIACNSGKYLQAESLYSAAIQVQPHNCAVYGSRSAARVFLKKFNEALQDAEYAIELDPTYSKGFFRLGVALQHVGKSFKALVAFAKAMALDAKNPIFLNVLTETALNSSLKASLQPVLLQLKGMNLESNPFVITSVIGQDLLAHNATSEAVDVLECALSIGTYSLKLKGSVYSALGSALWSMDHYERALVYMKEDLVVSQQLSDPSGECRAHSNLAAAHLFQGRLEEAAASYKSQLTLAQKIKHKRLTAAAYGGLGLVCTALGDHRDAVQHHSLAVEIASQTKDYSLRCRELNKVAQSYLLLGDPLAALKSQKERLRLASDHLADGGKEEMQAYFDIATVYKQLKRPMEEMSCLQKASEISKKLGDLTNEGKTLISLGYAARHKGDMDVAKKTYERLLEIALESKDKSLEARACANLGIVYHQMSDYELALKLQARCLTIAKSTSDVASQGRAYGNMGNAYSAMGLYEQAVSYHLRELEISTKIDDKESECSTHGNLAVAYQALQVQDRALHHYRCQYELAKQIGNVSNQSRSLMNLGNFHNTVGRYREAMELYHEYLQLATQETEKSGQCRALYNLGFAYFSLKQYPEAVESYLRSVEVAKECQDKLAMARAYCNLGLARKELGQHELAFDCQNLFLTLSTELKSTRGKFKALGNLGDIFVAKQELNQATGFYQQQLALAEQSNDSVLIAQACASLGTTLRGLGHLEQAAEIHTREVNIYRNSVKESKVEYKAQGRLGATLTALEQYRSALVCYERQLELAVASKDASITSQAHCNLAITYTNLHDFENARKHFQQQADCLQDIKHKSARTEKCKAFCNLGKCCEALELYDEAVTNHQIALDIANDLRSFPLMEKSLKGLASTHRQLHKVEQATQFCQQRLAVCERMAQPSLIASACGDLAVLLSETHKHLEAIEHLKRQMKIGVDASDQSITADAACGIGSVYQAMRDFDNAVNFHKLDLEISQKSDNQPCQGRAHGNLAAVYEQMGNHDGAIAHQEQHLFIANEQNDEVAKQIALYGIGRNTLLQSNGDYSRAALLLQQAMLLHNDSTSVDLIVKTRHYLGIAMLACGNQISATEHLKKAATLAEDTCWQMLRDWNPPDDNLSAYDTELNLFETLNMCYASLLHVLVKTGRHDEALEIAEKLKSFTAKISNADRSEVLKSTTVMEMKAYCKEHRTVMYYAAVCSGHLYRWLITPEGELLPTECEHILNEDATCGNVIQALILGLRQTLGVENEEIEESDLEDKNLEVNCLSLFSKLLQLRRKFQCYCDHIKTSQGLLLSDNNAKQFDHKSPYYSLYELLFGGFDTTLRKYMNGQSPTPLNLVIDGDLILVPFCMMKKRPSDHFLSENFHLTSVNSFHDLTTASFHNDNLANYQRGLVVGNPTLPASLLDHGWIPSQAADEEANLIGGVLRVEPITGRSANKEEVMAKCESAEVVHFACHVTWGCPTGVVLCSSTQDDSAIGEVDEFSLATPTGEKTSPMCKTLDLTDHVLSDTDILALNLSKVKLVVLGSSYLCKTQGTESHISKLASSVTSLTSAFSVAGARTLLFSMWPVPETAWKLIAQTFFAKLLDGVSTCEALEAAMTALRDSQQFGHPSYWAGFVLLGPAARLSEMDLSTINALYSVLQGSGVHAQGVIKLMNHLIGKSLKREAANDNNNSVPMYTSQESVAEKLHDAKGWRELFSASGFELRASSNGLPPAIFFPQPHNNHNLESISSMLKPFLELPSEILTSLGQLTLSPGVANALLNWLRAAVLAPLKESTKPLTLLKQINADLHIDRNVWESDGCSQLLSNLGIHMTTVQEDTVNLSVKPNLSLDVLSAVTEALHILFGSYCSREGAELAGYEQTNGHDEKDSHVAYKPKVAKVMPQTSRPSRQRISTTRFPIAIDFNSSYQSISTSEESWHQHDSNDNSASRGDCGILTLEEPKVFTQVPSGTGLIVPTPVMPQKSPHVSPTKLSSPSAFSPTRKFQHASSFNDINQASLPSFLAVASDEQRREVSPVTPNSPGKSPGVGHSNVGAMFYQASRGHDPKVCVVNPTPGEQQKQPTSRKSEERFMTVFEDMLVRKSSQSSSGRKGSLTESVSSINSVNKIQKPPKRETEHGYKPSRSAASTLNSYSPQREYSDIVDQLSQARITPGLTQDLTHTHTAYRIVNTPHSGAKQAPKVQAYKVETVFTPISTETSLIGDPNRLTASASFSGIGKQQGGAKSPARSVPSASSPSSRSDIFQHLSTMSKDDNADERVEFV
uniref:Tetratricopeptide repeat protein 28 n=1 Tax=Phallusia mammillata TaxID=59560 RepID=A0A6F9DV65_9ASCI|nr:tetratricopeptide repeat protein 28 [Phallusia mammillata]